jgi:ammonium transporter Rh
MTDQGDVSVRLSQIRVNKEAVRKKLDNYTDKKEWTNALLSACDALNLAEVSYLVHEVRDGAADRVGFEKGDKGVKEFISAGDYDKRTPLHIAAAAGSVEICRFLVQKGAAETDRDEMDKLVNATDRFDGHPIEDAARHGREEVVAYLKNEPCNAKMQNVDAQQSKMLKYAAKGLVDKMEEIISTNSKPEDLINCCDYDHRTPLHVAAAGGHLEAVVWLIDNYAQLKRDAFGKTALDDAVRTKARVGSDALSEKLRELQDKEGTVEGDHEEQGNPLFWKVFLFVQAVMIVLYATVTRYDNTTAGSIINGSPNAHTYPLFQDVHVMIFIGFGYLMTFLRKYGFSAVGLNFVVACLCIQWHILVGGFSEQWTHVGFHASEFHKINISLNSFLLADFAAASVLISFGALLGKVSPTQLLLLGMLEIVFFSFNECISLNSWHVSDMGGSMVVHVFGAYFGLAASWVLTSDAAKQRSENSSDYRSDLFAMIGTLFLWIFWPSFTGSPAGQYSQERVVVNTLLALCGSCLTGFCFSAWLRGENKFDMVDIQNATLAGGVAIGTACDMYVHPGGALAIGAFAGAWSVFGYTKIQGVLEQYLGVYDTCGVNNLHGMPGIIAGLAGFLVTAGADKDDFGGSDCVFQAVYGGRYSSDSDCCTTGATCTQIRTAGHQAGVQIGYLGLTFLIAIVCGVISGYIVKWIEPVNEEGAKSFQDDENWEVPTEETPYYFDPRGTIKRTKEHGTAQEIADGGISNKQHEQPLGHASAVGVGSASDPAFGGVDDRHIASQLEQLARLIVDKKEK